LNYLSAIFHPDAGAMYCAPTNFQTLKDNVIAELLLMNSVCRDSGLSECCKEVRPRRCFFLIKAQKDA
ncbi:MAG: hypothetical protein K2K05_11315, partial [Muribaculaceae bacterium]|nr:hypothetical protein [Muribaculaceae bacterium]